MARSKEECAALIDRTLDIRGRCKMALAEQAAVISHVDLSPSEFNETLLRILQDKNTILCLKDMQDSLTKAGITQDEMRKHGFLNDDGDLLVAKVVTAAELNVESILNDGVVKPDQAVEIIRLLTASQHKSLKEAAIAAREEGIAAGWVSIGDDHRTIESFFANCAYFGINGNKREHSADAGEGQLEKFGLLRADGRGYELNVGEIAKIAARHVRGSERQVG